MVELNMINIDTTNNAWRREWQSTPVFLPGESHGQRSLAGYNPQGCKESDVTEQLTLTSNAIRTPENFFKQPNLPEGDKNEFSQIDN